MIILAQSHCHCRRRHYSNCQCRRHHCGCRRRYCWCCDVVVVVVLRLLLLLLMQMMRCDWCYERPLFLIFVFLIVIIVVVDGVVATVVIAIDVVVADVLVVGVVRDVVVDQNWHNPISVISGTFCSRIGCRIFSFFFNTRIVWKLHVENSRQIHNANEKSASRLSKFSSETFF